MVRGWCLLRRQQDILALKPKYLLMLPIMKTFTLDLECYRNMQSKQRIPYFVRIDFYIFYIFLYISFEVYLFHKFKYHLFFSLFHGNSISINFLAILECFVQNFGYLFVCQTLYEF